MALPDLSPEQRGKGQPEEFVTPEGAEMLKKIPNLVDAVEENHLKIEPILDEEGNITSYNINSRGGRQLFRVGKDDMTFAIVRDTILTAAADQEEVESNFNIIESVQRSLHKLGMKDKDIPTTPHEIAQQVITLMQDFEKIQKAKSNIDIQNNFQAFLDMSQRVFAGGKNEWNQLSAPQQRWLIVFGDTLLVRALEELGVGQGTLATSETVKEIAENLSSMRREAAWYTNAGKALKSGLAGINAIFVGDEEVKGLIPGVVDIVGGVVGGAVDKTGDTIARGVDGIRERSKQDKAEKDKNKKDGSK